MFATYQETLHYLYENLPMFQRVGASAYKKDLTNTIELCRILGDPHQKFKSIHVAGTNGKGSTSHMIASILQSAGYKTGLYTSPHLKEFTERIRINGKEIDREFVVDFVNRIRPGVEDIRPSFFELTVVMAFEYFAAEMVDVAVIEVGMGGRLDSTNVITPEVSVITNIGYDHMDLLGDTLEKIAVEKAGIIKPGIPVVISERQPVVAEIFENTARIHKAPLYFASMHYDARRNRNNKIDIFYDSKIKYADIDLPLKGNYQLKNLPGVFKAINILQDRGFLFTDDKIHHGLEYVVEQTGLKGRWQKLGDHPLMICDTGHNVDGVQVILDQISTTPHKKLFMVWGMVKDKDRKKIFQLLPKSANYYFCQAKIPRALDAQALAEEAMIHGITGTVVPDVNDAIKLAKQQASVDDLIFIGGSTFVVAEIENL